MDGQGSTMSLPTKPNEWAPANRRYASTLGTAQQFARTPFTLHLASQWRWLSLVVGRIAVDSLKPEQRER